MLMGSNPNTSAPRRASEWSAELPIKPKPMMATSQVRMAIVFLQRRRSGRGGGVAGGAVADDSGHSAPRVSNEAGRAPGPVPSDRSPPPRLNALLSIRSGHCSPEVIVQTWRAADKQLAESEARAALLEFEPVG